jgi:hypothetical protein
LHALRSEDLNSTGKVEVRARLVSAERQNEMLEEIVSKMTGTLRSSPLCGLAHGSNYR